MKTCRGKNGPHEYEPKDSANKQGCPTCAFECRKGYLKNWHQSDSAKTSKKKYNSRPENKSKRANEHLLEKYGITLEQKRQMIDNQCGKCFLCPHTFKNVSDAHVDHNHKTGKVRKLLCGACNKALGYIKENFDTAINLAKYIQEDQGVI